MAVGRGVPERIVDAVQYTAELAVMGLQNTLQPHPLLGVLDLPGVARRDRVDEVGEDDPALHQIHRTRIGRILETVRRHEARRIQTDLTQDGFTHDTLVADVVQAVADARICQPKPLVHLE